MSNLLNKASIVLTPTAYSDGSLNTVIPPYAPSYIENVSFVTSEWDNLLEGWSIDETNNKLVAEATWTGQNRRAQYSISEIQVGRTVKFSFDAVVTAGKFHFLAPFPSGDVGYGGPDFINQSGSYSFTFVASGASVYFRNKSTDFAGEITNIRVEVIEEADFDFSRGSSATRVNEQGLVEDVASGIPRIDYTDGTGSLLLEPQSTNKVTQSETFFYLGKRNSFATSVSLTAPDGSNSVIKLSSNSTIATEHKVQINIDTTPSTDSIFAKMGEVRYIFSMRNSTSGWQSVVFDLQEGVVAANNYSSDVYPKITYYGNGWYRCEVYYSVLGDPETGWGLSDGTNHIYTPTNTTDGLYVWGAQQEDLSYATSYIPTTSSTVTRSADVANDSGNADLFNDSEGVLYAEIAIQGNTENHQNITASDSSTNNYLKIIYLNNTNKIRGEIKGGGSSEYIDFTNIQFKQFYKVAISYKSSEFKMFVDGTQIGNTITSFNLPTGLSGLAFDRGDGQLDFHSKTKCVAVFKEALSDAELACLTSQG